MSYHLPGSFAAMKIKCRPRQNNLLRRNYPNADSATKANAYDARLKRLLDSTKDVTVHYGFTGAISYEKAKNEELNLGLDLKGGINVTMEVELSGLIRAMANNSKDPNFLKALENANTRKANSGADYIIFLLKNIKS